jgi:hypothetical protein
MNLTNESSDVCKNGNNSGVVIVKDVGINKINGIYTRRRGFDDGEQ